MDSLTRIRNARVVASGLGSPSVKAAASTYISKCWELERVSQKFASQQAIAFEVEDLDKQRRAAHNKLAAVMGVSRDVAHKTLFGKR